MAPGHGIISGSNGPRKNTIKGLKGPWKSINERHTSGSKGPRKRGKVKMAATITYLSLCRYLLSFSERFLYRILEDLRSNVIKSIYKPSGHIQPQKKRPKTIVMTTITPKTRDGH
jgi:hypothetical protein